MAVKDVSGTQGSFINRTKTLDIHPGGVASLVRRVSGEIFEPTSSNFSTAFIGISSKKPIIIYEFSLVDGGQIDKKV